MIRPPAAGISDAVACAGGAAQLDAIDTNVGCYGDVDCRPGIVDRVIASPPGAVNDWSETLAGPAPRITIQDRVHTNSLWKFFPRAMLTLLSS